MGAYRTELVATLAALEATYARTRERLVRNHAGLAPEEITYENGNPVLGDILAALVVGYSALERDSTEN